MNKKNYLHKVLATTIILGCFSMNASAVIISSTDVPKTFVDNNPVGFTTTLIGPNLLLTDLNVIFDDLRHTSVPDIHGELTSPSGTTVTFLKAFTEGGILTGLGTPNDFIGTILDDQAINNLASGASPYTGSFNVNHASSGINNPFTIFNGENASGTWTLFLSDLAQDDVGRLTSWSMDFSGTSAIPEPASLALLGLGLAGIGFSRRKAA